MSNVESAAAAGDSYDLRQRAARRRHRRDRRLRASAARSRPPSTSGTRAGRRPAAAISYSLATGVADLPALHVRAVPAARRDPAGAGDRPGAALHRPRDRRAGVPRGAEGALRGDRAGDRAERRRLGDRADRQRARGGGDVGVARSASARSPAPASSTTGLPSSAQGAVLAGMVLGAIAVFMIDRRFLWAAGYAFFGAALAAIGLIHGEKVEFFADLEIALGYAFLGARLPRVRTPCKVPERTVDPDDPVDVEDAAEAAARRAPADARRPRSDEARPRRRSRRDARIRSRRTERRARPAASSSARGGAHARAPGSRSSTATGCWPAARELAAGPRGRRCTGVPFAVKDNIDVAGHADHRRRARRSPTAPRRSAAAVAAAAWRRARCRSARRTWTSSPPGSSGTRSPYGACSSVFDPRHVSGGSSSGSAVAVGATASVPLALGTDTAGSGRVPAAFNGDRRDQADARPGEHRRASCPACRSLDCVSVFAADVDGGRRALAALAGVTPRTRTRARRRRPRAAPGRAAADRRPAGAPRARRGRRRTPGRARWRTRPRLADELVEVDLDPFLEAGRAALRRSVGRRAATPSRARRSPRGGPGVDPVVARARARRRALDGGRRVPRAQESLARAARGAARRRGRGVDALLVPTAPVPSDARRGRRRSDRRQRARSAPTRTFANLLDLCAVAVPAGAARRRRCRSA